MSTPEQRSEELDNRISAIALKADCTVMDIYNAVFRRYKADNALREEANKNERLKIEEGRIRLAGKQFLIDDYYATKKWNKIRRRAKFNNLFKITPKKQKP